MVKIKVIDWKVKLPRGWKYLSSWQCELLLSNYKSFELFKYLIPTILGTNKALIIGEPYRIFNPDGCYRWLILSHLYGFSQICGYNHRFELYTMCKYHKTLIYKEF